jgi:transcriptional regulator with XRE-family HTH domain
MTTALGKYIADRRKSLHLSQEDVAKRLESYGQYRAASTIANWETGRQKIPVELLEPLSKALDEHSPTPLFMLAGIFDNVPGIGIIKRLANASEKEVSRLERVIDALLQEQSN